MAAARGELVKDKRDGQMKPSLPEFQVQQYIRHLSDFPADVLAAAADRIVATHEFPRFPSVADFTTACMESMRPELGDSTAAWLDAYEAIKQASVYDPERTQRAFDRLPEHVRSIVRAMGAAVTLGQMPPDRLRQMFFTLWDRRAREIRATGSPIVAKQLAAIDHTPSPERLRHDDRDTDGRDGHG